MRKGRLNKGINIYSFSRHPIQNDRTASRAFYGEKPVPAAIFFRRNKEVNGALHDKWSFYFRVRVETADVRSQQATILIFTPKQGGEKVGGM